MPSILLQRIYSRVASEQLLNNVSSFESLLCIYMPCSVYPCSGNNFCWCRPCYRSIGYWSYFKVSSYPEWTFCGRQSTISCECELKKGGDWSWSGRYVSHIVLYQIDLMIFLKLVHGMSNRLLNRCDTICCRGSLSGAVDLQLSWYQHCRHIWRIIDDRTLFGGLSTHMKDYRRSDLFLYQAFKSNAMKLVNCYIYDALTQND